MTPVKAHSSTVARVRRQRLQARPATPALCRRLRKYVMTGSIAREKRLEHGRPSALSTQGLLTTSRAMHAMMLLPPRLPGGARVMRVAGACDVTLARWGGWHGGWIRFENPRCVRWVFVPRASGLRARRCYSSFEHAS